MKDVKWYFHRLRAMSISEIWYRLRKLLMREPRIGQIDSTDVAYRLTFRDFSGVDVTSNMSRWAKDYQRHAEKRVKGLYDIFELRNLSIGQPNWRKDYGSGKEAPFLPADQLDYRAFDRIGNIKYIWELNRHQFLIPVAIQYFLTGDVAYKHYVLEMIHDWLEKNPYLIGINWTSCLELGVRLTSWYVALGFLVSRDNGLPKAFEEQVAKAIYEHAFHIHNNPSLFSSANNHLVGEKTGLVCAGAMLREHPDVSVWLEAAVNQLIDEAKRQVFLDGVGVEQSPSYQAHTVGYYILCISALEEMGRTAPPEFLDLVDRSARFYEAIVDIRGNVPDFGDNDGGKPIFLYASDNFNVYRSIIDTNRVLHDVGVHVDKIEDPSIFWLFRKRFASPDTMNVDVDRSTSFQRQTQRSFPDGGYYILGQDFEKPGEIKIIFDCGPLGFGAIAAHGHADALSFTLNRDGVPFLVDSGTYKYFVEAAKRNYFRSTAAHNTVRIDGRDQSEILGPFLWGRRAIARLNYAKLDEDRQEVAGSHDGYVRCRGGVLHQRQLVYEKSQRILRVFDRLEMENEHLVELFYQFDSKCEVKLESATSLLLSSGGQRIRMTLDPLLDWRIAYGESHPLLGWQSIAFGEMHMTNTLHGMSRPTGPQVYCTEIQML